ncbi:PD40 domain-containing protein [candidate division KSB1 bacterium]|nr:PD40 domain-containing protein [candidate division KSB1 bacterium]
MGFRDLWAVDVKTGSDKLVLRDTRLGSFCIHPQNHSLWGIRIHNGLSMLFSSPYPYHKILPLFTIDAGIILTHLAISPDGRSLAATLHRESGAQEIIVLSLDQILKQKRLLYSVISAEGNPEHPSWSADSKTLYWNACISGVSNIFCRQQADSTIVALSNVHTGLFHPVCLPGERLIAFVYTSLGFQSCIIPEKRVSGIAAIEFLGQKVVEKYPQVRDWRIQFNETEKFTDLPVKRYYGLFHLKHNSLIPTIGALQSKMAGGLFYEMADPLYYHQVILHAGLVSPRTPYLEFRYTYKDILTFRARKSPASFYDLVNKRKVNQPGENILIEYKKRWLWDMPSTREQWFYFHCGEGLTDTGNEQQKLSLGRIYSFGTRFKHRQMRKSIGSVDDEKGVEVNVDVRYSRTDHPPVQIARFFGMDFQVVFPIFRPHNHFRLGVSGGYTTGDNLYTCLSYFGGFGNRLLEDRSSDLFREVAAFPGIAYRQYVTRDYAKLTVENILPPVHVGKALNTFYAEKIYLSLFSQLLLTHPVKQKFICMGCQINLSLKYFFVLESVLSCGYALSRELDGVNYNDFFISLKILRKPNG